MARTKKKSDRSDSSDKDAGSNGPEAVAKAEPGKVSPPLPKPLQPTVDAAAIETKFGSFDLDDPRLPDWVEAAALGSGGYPYDETLKTKVYDAELEALQIELVKLQYHMVTSGLKLALLFEGRDAAGKGGAIAAFRQYLNPRNARDVALPKPTETQRGQWYFQRYVEQLPTAGELVTFDRSWYNRAGVETVMGFCTPAERDNFLAEVSPFEGLLVDAGIILFKFWLDIGREMQMKRFHERRHNPLKIWKLSSMDYAALGKWNEYTAARDAMIKAAHTDKTPWTIVLANDKRRARLNIMRHVLSSVPYPDRNKHVVKTPDPRIVGEGWKFLKKNG